MSPAAAGQSSGGSWQFSVPPPAGIGGGEEPHDAAGDGFADGQRLSDHPTVAADIRHPGGPSAFCMIPEDETRAKRRPAQAVGPQGTVKNPEWAPSAAWALTTTSWAWNHDPSGRTLFGATEPVTIALDRALPAGPWDARVTLRSGYWSRAPPPTSSFRRPGRR
jgi:hypothetical protein